MVKRFMTGSVSAESEEQEPTNIELAKDTLTTLIKYYHRKFNSIPQQAPLPEDIRSMVMVHDELRQQTKFEEQQRSQRQIKTTQ